MNKHARTLAAILLLLAVSISAIGYAAVTYTTYYGMTKLPRGSAAWDTTNNANLDTIDAAIKGVATSVSAEAAARAVADAALYSYILLKYGDLVARLGDLPEIYIMTGTFNGPTGTNLAIPKSVSAVTEYAVAVETTARTGAVGDIYVTQGLDNATIHCAENNTTDTFKAIVIYSDDQNTYGTAIHRKWYVSPSDAITDHCDNTTEGSLAWVAAQIGSYYATVELPGNHIYDIDSNCTIQSTVQLLPQYGAVLKPASGKAITFHSPEQVVAAPNQFVYDGAGRILFSNAGRIYVDWWGPHKDGATDDHADLKAAHDSAAVNSTLVLGPGSYMTDSEWLITTGVNVEGTCGISGSTIIAGASLISGSVVTYYPTNPYLEFLTLSCLTVDGNRTAENALEIKNGSFVKVEDVLASKALNYGHYVNAWGTYTLGKSQPNAQIQNVKYVHAKADHNGVGYRIANNGNGMGMVFALENCWGYYNDISIEAVGDNTTKVTDDPWDNGTAMAASGDLGFTLKISGGSFEAGPKEAANYDLIPVYGIVARNGITLSIEDTYIENYRYLLDGTTTDYHYWLSGGSLGNLRGGNIGTTWYSRVDDTSLLCQQAGGLRGIPNTLDDNHSIAGNVEPFCIGSRIADKDIPGPPNWPVESTGGFVVYKGQRAVDSAGNKWVQVADGTPSGTAVVQQSARWAPEGDSVLIPFDNETLNSQNIFLWWAQEDYLLTGIDVVVEEAFTHDNGTGFCSGVYGITIGTTDTEDARNKYMRYDELSGAALGISGNIIRASDNPDTGSDEALLSWVAESGKHRARFMPGYPIDLTGSWETTYNGTYILGRPCPYGTESTGYWTSGKGYFLIHGKALRR